MVHTPQRARLLVFCLAFLPGFIRAFYFLDDKNTTIQYSGWGPSDDNPYLNYSGAYGGNTTACHCISSDGNYMKIPFHGSGITIYAVLIWAMNFNASIDGGPQTNHHFDGIANCCNDTIKPIYNYTIYNHQFLPQGNHSLEITLLNVTSGYVYDGGYNYLRFDYAMVNETDPNTVVVSQASRAINAPIIMGAVAGGVVAILALLLVIYYARRRARLRDSDLLGVTVEPESPNLKSGSNTPQQVPPDLPYDTQTKGAADPSSSFTSLSQQLAHLSPEPFEMPITPPEPTKIPPSTSRPPTSDVPGTTTFQTNPYSHNVPPGKRAIRMEPMHVSPQNAEMEDSNGLAGRGRGGFRLGNGSRKFDIRSPTGWVSTR